MKKYAVIWKRVGETPLEATEAYRRAENMSPHIPLAYAGRLDPMAEGKLLVLMGDECKKLAEYAGLDKEYEFEVLFGVSSDTGDVLGLVGAYAPVKNLEVSFIRSAAKKFRGENHFPYPNFSSKTVQGKPLHKWALENRLDEIDIPVRSSRVYAIRLLGVRTVSARELEQDIFKKIDTLSPVTDPDKAWGTDFRREPILKKWREVLSSAQGTVFSIARFRAAVSSGTYIRTIAEKIGQELGVPALAYAITRTKFGTYTSIAGMGFWRRVL